MFHSLSVYNNKYFSKIKKKYKVGKTEVKFTFISKKVKSIDACLVVFKHFPKFQRKIFIIVNEKWVNHNCSYGNSPKSHMPLTIRFFISGRIT